MGNVCTSQKSVSAFEPFQNPTDATASIASQPESGVESSEHHTRILEATTSQESKTVVYEDAPLPAQSISTSAEDPANVQSSPAVGPAPVEAETQAEQSASAEESSREPPPFRPPANYRARRRCSVGCLMLSVERMGVVSAQGSSCGSLLDTLFSAMNCSSSFRHCVHRTFPMGTQDKEHSGPTCQSSHGNTPPPSISTPQEPMSHRPPSYCHIPVISALADV